MADDNQQEATTSRVTRRQLIKGGMVAGGVALWSAPVVAAARYGHFDRVRTLNPATGGAAAAPAGPAAPARTAPVQNSASTVTLIDACVGYPPGTYVTFECGGSVTECGTGVTVSGYNFRCFCDQDVEGRGFCGNDAPCGLLSSCSENGDCPPGWACIPSSCCAGAKCVPPCGTFPNLASPGGGKAGIAGKAGIQGTTPTKAELAKILAGARMSGLSR